MKPTTYCNSSLHLGIRRPALQSRRFKCDGEAAPAVPIAVASPPVSSTAPAVPSNSNLSVTSNRQEKHFLCFAAALTSKWHPGLRWLPSGSAAGRSWLKGKLRLLYMSRFPPPATRPYPPSWDGPTFSPWLMEDGDGGVWWPAVSWQKKDIVSPVFRASGWNQCFVGPSTCWRRQVLCFNCLTGDGFSRSLLQTSRAVN